MRARDDVEGGRTRARKGNRRPYVPRGQLVISLPVTLLGALEAIAEHFDQDRNTRIRATLLEGVERAWVALSPETRVVVMARAAELAALPRAMAGAGGARRRALEASASGNGAAASAATTTGAPSPIDDKA